MINKRLFTFGCSHTSYHWPSWADMIGMSYKEYYNYGMTGAGNYYILTQLYEVNEVYNFTENDVILIMLSSDDRADFILPINQWSNSGGLYNASNIRGYGKSFMQNIWSEDHAINQGWVFTKSIFHFLNSLNCDFRIYSAFKQHEIVPDIPITERQLKINNRKFNYISGEPLMKYKNIKNSYRFVHDETHEIETDNHLTITEHYEWVIDNGKEYLEDTQIQTLIKNWEEKITLESRMIVRERFGHVKYKRTPFILGS